MSSARNPSPLGRGAPNGRWGLTTPALALGLLLVTACGSTNPTPADAGADAGTDAGYTVPRCSDAMMCRSGASCFSPYCTSGGWQTCTATSCPAGQHCEKYQVDNCGQLSISDESCRPDCPAAACPAGRVCGADGGCVDAPCMNNSDCSSLFECTNASVCQPKRCQLDGDCPGGYCVNFQCAATLGYCNDI